MVNPFVSCTEGAGRVTSEAISAEGAADSWCPQADLLRPYSIRTFTPCGQPRATSFILGLA
jgi:hypothetical protein